MAEIEGSVANVDDVIAAVETEFSDMHIDQSCEPIVLIQDLVQEGTTVPEPEIKHVTDEIPVCVGSDETTIVEVQHKMDVDEIKENQTLEPSSFEQEPPSQFSEEAAVVSTESTTVEHEPLEQGMPLHAVEAVANEAATIQVELSEPVSSLEPVPAVESVQSVPFLEPVPSFEPIPYSEPAPSSEQISTVTGEQVPSGPGEPVASAEPSVTTLQAAADAKTAEADQKPNEKLQADAGETSEVAGSTELSTGGDTAAESSVAAPSTATDEQTETKDIKTPGTGKKFSFCKTS